MLFPNCYLKISGAYSLFIFYWSGTIFFFLLLLFFFFSFYWIHPGLLRTKCLALIKIKWSRSLLVAPIRVGCVQGKYSNYVLLLWPWELIINGVRGTGKKVIDIQESGFNPLNCIISDTESEPTEHL